MLRERKESRSLGENLPIKRYPTTNHLGRVKSESRKHKMDGFASTLFGCNFNQTHEIEIGD